MLNQYSKLKKRYSDFEETVQQLDHRVQAQFSKGMKRVGKAVRWLVRLAEDSSSDRGRLGCTRRLIRRAIFYAFGRRILKDACRRMKIILKQLRKQQHWSAVNPLLRYQASPHKLTSNRAFEHNALAGIMQSVEEVKNMVREAHNAGRRIEKWLCRSSHHTEPATISPTQSPSRIHEPTAAPLQHWLETLQGSNPGQPGWPTADHAGFYNVETVDPADIGDIASSTYDNTDVESSDAATNDDMEDGEVDIESNFSSRYDTDALSSAGDTEAASVDMETESVGSEGTAYPGEAEPELQDDSNDAFSDTTATQASDNEAEPDTTAPGGAEGEASQTPNHSPDDDIHAEQPSARGPSPSGEQASTQAGVSACEHRFQERVRGYRWSLVVFASCVNQTRCIECGLHRTTREFSSLLREGENGGAEVNWKHISTLRWIPGASGYARSFSELFSSFPDSPKNE